MFTRNTVVVLYTIVLQVNHKNVFNAGHNNDLQQLILCQVTMQPKSTQMFIIRNLLILDSKLENVNPIPNLSHKIYF